MATEIERKFLIANDDWRAQVTSSKRLVQGYLNRGDERSIRVRIGGDKANINIKSTQDGIHRLEYEYEIPMADAEEMLEKVALPTVIDKVRHLIPAGDGLTWEVDEFAGANAGLIIAEIELPSAAHPFTKPGWLGEEVSHDRRYYNSKLAATPFGEW